MRSIPIIFITLLSYNCLIGQNLFTQEYTLQDGLPEIELIDVKVDHKGNIWYVGPNYLGYYNGYEFKFWHKREIGLNHEPLNIIYQENNALFCFRSREVSILQNYESFQRDTILSKLNQEPPTPTYFILLRTN